MFSGGNVTQIDWFLGIPYAEPPVGELRFKASYLSLVSINYYEDINCHIPMSVN